MSKRFLLAVVFFLVFGALAGGLLGRFSGSSASTAMTPAKVTFDYREALDVIDRNYVGAVKHEELSEKSIQSMLWTLDPHSAFFTAEEVRKMNEEQASEFYGIGVSIFQHRDGVYVQSVIPNTPADKAGLRYGDKFLFIDGKDAAKWTSSEVSKNVRGERGTSVNVKVERAGTGKPLEFDIVRNGVPYPSIRNYFMLPDGVGYVGMTGAFQETTSAELDEAVASLKKQGMKSLVLDLRGNPGGLLDQARGVVSRFIEKGKVVVSVKGRSRGTDGSREYLTTGGTIEKLPLVVLINGGSASASEIVAGAIQDYHRGIVVGTESFGKGLVQRPFVLPYGTRINLTTARYYTPYGRSLQRDYSNGSIYEYYTHSGQTGEESPAEKPAEPAGVPVTTADGRVLYGGRGIEPDVKIAAVPFSPIRGRINEAVFFFVRQLVSGQVKGFESYRREKQSFAMTVAPNDLLINERLFETFVTAATGDRANGLSAENLTAQQEYAKARLRQELATAFYSSEAGAQVLLENDTQVLKALELIPEAAKLTGPAA